MNTLILVGLSIAVLFAAAGRGATQPPQSPQVIYVQAAPAEPTAGTGAGAGCLPLLVLVGVIVLAVVALR
jgi:hypothetical protein